MSEERYIVQKSLSRKSIASRSLSRSPSIVQKPFQKTIDLFQKSFQDGSSCRSFTRSLSIASRSLSRSPSIVQKPFRKSIDRFQKSFQDGIPSRSLSAGSLLRPEVFQEVHRSSRSLSGRLSIYSRSLSRTVASPEAFQEVYLLQTEAY